ncbi:MAG: formyl transferase [Bacteroidota bacterium]
MGSDYKIVLLCGEGQSSNIVYNFLHPNFGVHLAIKEEKENYRVFLQRRIKRLGIVTVLGQVAFQLLLAKPMTIFSRKRNNEIIANNYLDSTAIPGEMLRIVPSINSVKTIQLLSELNPDLIIINGTRIISSKVLKSVSCTFINIHAGITPKYRGVHGAYWALTQSDPANCGVTVHLVDAGIDTGNILYQQTIIPAKNDNYATYPLVQLAAGLPLLKKAIDDCINKTVTVREGTAESHLWYHPTIWSYLYNRIVKKVK